MGGFTLCRCIHQGLHYECDALTRDACAKLSCAAAAGAAAARRRFNNGRFYLLVDGDVGVVSAPVRDGGGTHPYLSACLP